MNKWKIILFFTFSFSVLRHYDTNVALKKIYCLIGCSSLGKYLQQISQKTPSVTVSQHCQTVQNKQKLEKYSIFHLLWEFVCELIRENVKLDEIHEHDCRRFNLWLITYTMESATFMGSMSRLGIQRKLWKWSDILVCNF